jgi:hypothetical protein
VIASTRSVQRHEPDIDHKARPQFPDELPNDPHAFMFAGAGQRNQKILPGAQQSQ